ncbi:hypothetical protein ACNPN6_06655 [Enterobacter quasiroggenkampii]|uniref:hypothetical protein n=1 Tax=Enterobacter quasiroggenkampii TaxID=2497436 RepID=UPI003AAD2206
MFKFKERTETKTIDVLLTETGDDDITVRQLRATYKTQGSFEIKSHYVITKDGEITSIRDVNVLSGVGEYNVVILVVGSTISDVQMKAVDTLVHELKNKYPGVETVSYKE